MTPVLSVENLELRFGAVVALAGVTFTVDVGERVALVGPNGAGKTSVLNCITGTERPSGGRVVVNGDGPVARTLQALGVVDELDVLGNLLLGRHHLMKGRMVACALRLPGARREEAGHAQRCREVAAELDLADHLHAPAARLGTGARKRLELGRALAMEGSLLLLDEPFAGASPGEVDLMVAAITRATDGGTAAVVVDHDIATVTALAHRVLALEGGRVARTRELAR